MKSITWRSKSIYLAILVAYTVGILVITLISRSFTDKVIVVLDPLRSVKTIFRRIYEGYQLNGLNGAIRRISWVQAPLSSLLLNIILFIPIGYLLPLACESVRQVKKVVFFACTFSIIIEIIQLLSHLGWFDVSDIINNTVGAILGYYLYKKVF